MITRTIALRSLLGAVVSIIAGCGHTFAPPTTPAATDSPLATHEPADATLTELTVQFARSHGYASRLARLEWDVRDHLDAHPEDPRALVLLAKVLTGLDVPDEALAAAQRCVVVARNFSACWWQVAVLEEALQHAPRALEGYSKYVELAPNGEHASDARAAIARMSSWVAATGLVSPVDHDQAHPKTYEWCVAGDATSPSQHRPAAVSQREQTVRRPAAHVDRPGGTDARSN